MLVASTDFPKLLSFSTFGYEKKIGHKFGVKTKNKKSLYFKLVTDLMIFVPVTESQNCLVLPAPHKRASRPASNFTVLFYQNKY